MRYSSCLLFATFFSACSTVSGPITPSFAGMQGMLESHNQVRAKHGLAPLSWSMPLANSSQDWSNHLAANNSCRMQHRSHAGKDFEEYGENLFWASPKRWSDGVVEPQLVTAPEVAKAWADEWADYDYARDSCTPGKQCGHYTQMIWRDTTHVGCAMTLCPDLGQIWVCSYNPPGNWRGQRPY